MKVDFDGYNIHYKDDGSLYIQCCADKRTLETDYYLFIDGCSDYPYMFLCEAHEAALKVLNGEQQ